MPASTASRADDAAAFDQDVGAPQHRRFTVEQHAAVHEHRDGRWRGSLTGCSV